MMKALYLCIFALLLPWPARAGGIEQLHAFLDAAKTGRAGFSQTVVAKSGRQAPQEASGMLLFARPGKFRWTYDKPYYQLLVGDGDKLWVYDKDLSQVTVKTLGDALGATPAALLSGGKAWEKNFSLKDDGQSGALEWVQATPKAQDSTFQSIRIGLSDNLPRIMELHDNFGQKTTLAFERFERNPTLDASEFRFTPPPGADVVGE